MNFFKVILGTSTQINSILGLCAATIAIFYNLIGKAYFINQIMHIIYDIGLCLESIDFRIRGSIRLHLIANQAKKELTCFAMEIVNSTENLFFRILAVLGDFALMVTYAFWAAKESKNNQNDDQNDDSASIITIRQEFKLRVVKKG